MTEFKHFRVILPNGVDSAGIGEGFIDSRRGRAFPSLASTLALSQDKERAFMRWEAILNGLKVDSSPVSVSDIVETGGSENSAPSQIDFTVTYLTEQVVYVWDMGIDPAAPVIYGPASVDPGSVITEALVIERIIANALATVNVTAPDQFDPTLSNAFEDNQTTASLAGVRRVIQVADLTAAALGTGADVEARRDNIETIMAFTVTAL